MMSTTSLEDFLENIGELVYMSDPETFELVYINKFGRRTLGLKPASKISRIKCYEIVHDDPYVSEGYSVSDLKKGEFLEFDYYDPVSLTYYERKITLVDSAKFGRVRLEIDINLNQRQDDLNIVDELTYYIRLVNQSMVKALSSNDPDNAINDMLSYLGSNLECDRAYIFEFNDNDTCDNTYEWCKKGVIKQINKLKNVPSSIFNSWIEDFRAGRNVIISDIGQYRNKDRGMYNILKPQGIKSLVVGPISMHNKLIGLYGVDNPPSYKTENISTMFEVLSHFMAVLIRNRNNLKQLMNYSYTDQMTGVCNRHGLDRYLKKRDPDKPLVLILCDLNGLKAMNDNHGHEEGDKLILNLTKALLNRFSQEQIFRMGGDEFLVIVDCKSKEALDKTLEELRNDFERSGVSVATGAVWKQSDGHLNFDAVYDLVDEAMYKNKRAFYGERRHCHEDPCCR